MMPSRAEQRRFRAWTYIGLARSEPCLTMPTTTGRAPLKSEAEQLTPLTALPLRQSTAKLPIGWTGWPTSATISPIV